MASNIPVIVQGNSFSLAIPLQIYIINGDQMELQDYTPDPTDEISIQLKGERRQYTYTPTVDGNTCNIDLSGNELAGNYSVVVSIVKASGQRLRSFRTDQFFIVESSDDLTPADIIEGLEENVIYLNSSIFVAGEDGRGIESIVKTATAGLVDTYTITYSDNTTSTFNVTNGANGQAGAQGADGVGIASIAKTGTSGLVDTYTITLTNGNTYTFTVTNGEDGHDLGLAVIVDDLTTGGHEDALSAEMGKELKGLVDGCYTKDTSEPTEDRRYYTILGGEERIVTNVLDPTRERAKRATLSQRYTQNDFADAISANVPTGYYMAILQANAANDYIDSGWLSGTVDLTEVLDSGYNYIGVNFKASNDANFTEQKTAELQAGFYVVFRGGTSGSAIDIVNENGVPTKSIYNPSDAVNVQVYSKSAVDALLSQSTGGTTPYMGEKIKLGIPKFDFTNYGKIMTDGGKARQGAAVYDKYFFQFHTGNSYIQIYDITTKQLVQTLTLTENANCHAGSGGFGSFVDESDPFPLLYISSMDERLIYVYRITGAVGTLAIALYQTITLPSGTDLMFLPNVAIDADNGKLILFGYTKNSWRDKTVNNEENKSVIAIYDIPAITSDVTLTATDAQAIYYLPWIYAQQGACAEAGKLYMSWGNTSTVNGGGLNAINQGAIISSINFAVLGSYEPEGLGVYDGKLYMSSQNGRFFEFVF